jgi:Alginate lyase
MPHTADGQLPASPRRSLGTLGRFARLGLIGLAVVPFVLGEGLGLVASTESITVTASADAQVRSHFPDRNYGSAIRLRTRAHTGDSNRTLLRFTLPKLPGTVKSVTLQLFVRNGSKKGGAVHEIIGSWSENKVTWGTAPAIDPAIVGRVAAKTSKGRWISVPLGLSGLKSGKKIDLAIVGSSSGGAMYTSRETSHAPRLVLTVAPTPTKTASPTATPGATVKPASKPTPAPTGKPASNPTSAPTSAPGPTAAPTSAPVGGSTTPSVGIIISKSDLAALPTSGTAWNNLKSWADAAAGTPDIQNQDEDNDLHVLAKALVYARTGVASYRSAVLANLKAAVGTEAGGRTLALGRNLPGYVIAADLIDLAAYDPSFDSGVFRPWLRKVLTENLSGLTLVSTDEKRPNNWGTHAGAARAAVARYLGDSAQLARTAQVFHGWLGDRGSYAGFTYGDTSWQCDPNAPVGINPKGCTRSGIVVDGALPDDMRRGGGLRWPPAFTNYAWEAMQGATLEALILNRAGYDAFVWNDRALLRAASFLYDRALWVPSGDDTWQPWLLDHVYGMTWARPASARPGKNFGFTDWLFPR